MTNAKIVVLRAVALALALAASLLAGGNQARAQDGCSYIAYGAVLTAAQWNECFARKQNVLGYVPVNRAGDVMLGKLTTLASQTSGAGFNLPQGQPPANPQNGDLWTTLTGLYVRINGATVGPMIDKYPSIANGQILCNVSGSTAIPIGCDWGAYADVAIGNASGILPYRNGSAWTTISVGTSGSTIPLNNTANNFSAVQTINTNAAALPAPQAGAALQISQADSVVNRVELDGWGAASALTAVRANGTAASPSALGTDDEIVSVTAGGYDGASRSAAAAAVRLIADGAWAAGSHPTRTEIATTSSGSTTLTTRVTVASDGGVGIGAATSQGAGTLNLENALYANGTAPTGTGGYVRAATPTVSNLTVLGSFTATGLVANSDLVSPTITINSVPCTLGSTCAISATAASVTVASTGVIGGTSGRVLYDNAGTLGELPVTGTAGNVVLSGTPTIASPNFTGTVTGNATIPNAVLVNSSTTVNGTSCALGSTCTVTATATSITVGTTTVSGGSNGFVLYNDAGTLANKGTTGTGNVVQATSPTINSPALVTPALGVATATSINKVAITAPATGATLTIADGKTLTASNTLTFTGTDGTSFAFPGASDTVAGLAAAQALTNKTINCASNTCTVRAASDVTGLLPLANGGLNANLTASNGGVFYSTATAGAILAGTANADRPLLSGSSAAPAWGAFSLPASVTSGGVPYFSSSSAMASSGALTASAIVLGGGAGSAPTTLGSLGTTTTVLHGNASGPPTFGAVSLAADVSGVLPLSNGGTGNNLTASNGGVVYSDASGMQILAGTGTAGLCLISDVNSAPQWGSCSGAAAVSSVANSDSTLTISPTTGAVVASLNLGNANTWTAAQSFPASGVLIKGSSTGYTTLASLNSTGSANTISFPNVTDTVATLGTADQTLSGGANVTSQSLSTGSFTVNCGSRPLQYITGSTSSWTITAPSNDGSCIILLTNASSSAVIPTFSGFTVGSSAGAALTTTNSAKFYISVFRINGTAGYQVTAAQ